MHAQSATPITLKELEQRLAAAKADRTSLPAIIEATKGPIADAAKRPTLMAILTLRAAQNAVLTTDQTRNQWLELTRNLLPYNEPGTLAYEAKQKDPSITQLLGAARTWLPTPAQPTLAPQPPSPPPPPPTSPPPPKVELYTDQWNPAEPPDSSPKPFQVRSGQQNLIIEAPDAITAIHGFILNADWIEKITIAPAPRFSHTAVPYEDLQEQLESEPIPNLKDIKAEWQGNPTQGFASTTQGIHLKRQSLTTILTQPSIMLDIRNGQVAGIGERNDLIKIRETLAQQMSAVNRTTAGLAILTPKNATAQELNLAAFASGYALAKFDAAISQQPGIDEAILKERFAAIKFAPRQPDDPPNRISLEASEGEPHLLRWSPQVMDQLKGVNQDLLAHHHAYSSAPMR